MDKTQKEQKKNEIKGQFDQRIAYIQQQMDNLTKQHQEELRKLQEEMDSLTIQSEALNSYKIK